MVLPIFFFFSKIMAAFSEDTVEHRSMMNAQIMTVSELEACIKKQLTELEKAIEKAPASEASALKRVKGRLNRDFERVAKDANQIISQAREKEKSSKPSSSPQFVAYNGEDESGDNGVSQRQMQSQLTHNEGLIEERMQDIQGINQQVREVNEIFKDLAGIVQEQQADIDEIETTIETSHASAKQGLDEVQKAAEYQPKCVVQ